MSPFDQRLSLLRAAAEPTRLRLLVLLSEAELTVTELTVVLNQSQPGVSRHLKMLCEAGLAERHQEGAWVFYRASDTALTRDLIGGLDGPEIARDLAGLASIRAERAAAAARYFAENASEWDALRRLHWPEEEIEAALLAMAGPPAERMIDLGTGTGRMLVLFEGRYEEAIGFDTSPEMLSIARVKLEDAGLTRARVRRADLTDLPAEASRRDADLVLLHHVLHFLSEPEAALAAAGALLAPGGRVLIADFAPHEREELRERHQHRRLGFSDAEMARWAAAAGLRVAEDRAFPPPEPEGLIARLWRLDRPVPAPATKEAVHASA